MQPVKLAVLMTCHNRCTLTCRCLESVRYQHFDLKVQVEVFLVDDGSTDGTAKQVSSRFPEVTVIKGDGNLYWGGGMRTCFDVAAKKEFDYFVWLNDDVTLERNALNTLVATHRMMLTSRGQHFIVAGKCLDQEDRPFTGGLMRMGFLPYFSRVGISPDVRECHTMNGNCVLIPKTVAAEVGNIDAQFKHMRGDLDYGLRASRMGFRVCQAPGTVGTCLRHPKARDGWRNSDLPISKRLQLLHQPKYDLLGKREFNRRFFGLWAFLPILAVYLFQIPVEFRRLIKLYFR